MEIYSQDSTRVRINNLISNPVEQEKEDRSQLSYCFAKLGFQHLFHQKDNQLAISYLGNSSKPYSYKHFTSAKQIYEKGIKRFKSLYFTEDGDSSKRRRRGYSIDNDVNGAYYLNNWLSHEQYLCEKPAPDEKTAHLVYQILGMRWNKALEIINSLPRSAMVVAIEYILNGFKIISNLLNDQDKFFSQQFLGRQNYDIKVKFSSQSVGGYSNFVNIFDQETRNRFHQIKNIPRKVQILKLNMDYLIKFVASNKFEMKDNYLKLALQILGNRIDQEQTNIKQGDYLKILLNLDLRLPDRLNFATKLLNQRKRKQFCQELQQRLCLFPRLQNIIFYICHPILKHKEQKIEQICKCYLDQFLDLQTVAYLSLDFPFLKIYCLQFKQALIISSETKQLERLQNHLQLYKEKQQVRQEKPRKIYRRNTNFLSCVNVSEEKINEYKIIGQSDMACEICSKKMFQTESYMECQKCRHGGHINHIIKWFQEYQHCPNIGCPCICN